MKSSREDTLETTIENGSPVERFPVGDNVNELLQSELSCKPDHALKPTPRNTPECVRDPIIPLIKHPPSQSVLEDIMSSENLENEMSLLELEESKLITEINPNLDSYTAEIGLLPMIDYLFEEANISTTILMDEGSNTSFITTKLAEALYLKGRFKLTKILRAGEEVA